MAPIETTSTKADPKNLYFSALFLSVVTIFAAIWDETHPKPVPDTIKWCTIANASNESIRRHKPVLYVFTAEWCGPCKKMESVAFKRKDIADQINKDYVPVLVIDQKREKGKNPPEIEKLERQCDVEAFPTLVVVPTSLLDAKTKDIFSTGSMIEHEILKARLPWPFNSEGVEHLPGAFTDEFAEDMLETNHSRIPAHTGYSAPNDIKDYLYQCSIWHKLPLSRGKILWKPISDVSLNSKKPKLIAFVEDCGNSSDKMRLRLFEDDEACEFINENFNSSIVEIKRGSDATNSIEIIDLKKKYGIKSLPALVVLTNNQPAVQDGFSSAEHTLQFLERTLGTKR